MITFVTGNENKWKEIQAILGTSVPMQRAAVDRINSTRMIKSLILLY